MFIKEIIIHNSSTLFEAMSRTRSYSYKELQKLAKMEREPLCHAILQLLRENKITQYLKGPHIRYMVS